MTVTISRLFDDYNAASTAVSNLEAAGLPHADISIISNNSDNWYAADRGGNTTGRVDRDRDGVDDRAEAAGKGAGAGATVGGVAGLLAGLGVMAIPGVGPVVAAGWLASTLAGAAAGAATGGLLGALTQLGVPDEEAHTYAEGVRRGGTLVSARVPDGERARYEAILDKASVNVRERSAAYKQTGWTKFDPIAAPYNSDQVRTERGRYQTGRV